MPDTPHPREVLGDAWACLGGSAQTLVTQAGSVRLPWAVEQGRAGQHSGLCPQRLSGWKYTFSEY